MKRRRRVKLAVWGAIGTVFVVLCLCYGPDIVHLLRFAMGFMGDDPKLKYSASNDNNLRTLYTAFKEYHDSEGQYPDAAKWMDEIKPRIREDNMAKTEAIKKLINPLYPPKPGVFGYAMNDSASGKYKGDLKLGTILVFDSSWTVWNAHGDPKKLKPKGIGGNEGITVDGRIVKLP